MPLQGVRRLLCLGAHCRDLEHGAGGTISHVVGASPDIEVWWAVFSCEVPGQARKGRHAAKLFLDGAARTRVLIYGFREGSLLFQGEQVRDAFEDLAATFSPELVITHQDDGELDRRLISDITWEMFSGCAILEYEVFNGRSGLRHANLYVPLDEQQCRAKIERLRQAYGAQDQPNAGSDDVLWSLMRLRGAESRKARFAEAFHVRRFIGG